MELNVICLLSVMILTVLIMKGIYCWLHCTHHVPWESKRFSWSRKHDYVVNRKDDIQLEIPMEDIERTSTPVPTDVKMKARPDFQSDV